MKPKEEGQKPVIRNCRRCGRVFASLGSPICPQCIEKEEKQYDTVRKYLSENPRASIGEVSNDTGVPPEVVIEFLRRGLLLGVPHASGDETSACIICKKPLAFGRICPECEKALSGLGRAPMDRDYRNAPELRKAPNKDHEGEGARMYTIDMIRKKRPL